MSGLKDRIGRVRKVCVSSLTSTSQTHRTQMLKRSLALLLVLAASSFTTAKAQGVEPIDVGMVCGQTEFVAHNYSTATQVLVFHSGLTCTWRVLAPGTEFRSTYTREMLDGVTVEIANYDA